LALEPSDVFPHGRLRITAASSLVAVGNPIASAQHCIAQIAAAKSSHIVLLPELALGGYTCGDLFGTDSLLQAVAAGLLDDLSAPG
jgi:NAD+ synthase (glutamine-hydrolysing)